MKYELFRNLHKLFFVSCNNGPTFPVYISVTDDGHAQSHNFTRLMNMNADNSAILNVTTIEVDTKANKDAPSVATNLTIKWEGMTDREIQELAQQALIVKLQASWRKDGIPSGDHTVNAADFKVGTRAKRQPASVESLLAKMDPDARKAWLAEQLAKLGA